MTYFLEKSKSICQHYSTRRYKANIKYKKFSDVVGKIFDINGFKVIPIYHPSPISPLSYKGNEEIFKNLNIKEFGIQ